MERTENNNLATKYKKTERSKRKSFSTQEVNRFKLKLEPLNKKTIKKGKIQINSKNKSKFNILANNSIKPKKKLTIKIVDNSINDISNTSALENLTTKNSLKPCTKNIFNDGLKSRNKKIKRKIFLDSSYFNTTDSNNTVTPTSKTNTSSSYVFIRPYETLRPSKAKFINSRNKTNLLLDYNSNYTVQNINQKCSELTETSTLLKHHILQYPNKTKQLTLTLSASFKKKMENYDEKIQKEKEKKKKDEEIINDVIDEKDKNNKKYNEMLLLDMRSKTMRIMQEMKCIEKVTPYLAYHENDTVKRIFSFRGNRYLLDEKTNDDKKTFSVPKKKHTLLHEHFNISKAQKLMNQTNKMLHLVNKSYKLNMKLNEKLSKYQDNQNNATNTEYFV